MFGYFLYLCIEQQIKDDYGKETTWYIMDAYGQGEQRRGMPDTPQILLSQVCFREHGHILQARRMGWKEGNHKGKRQTDQGKELPPDKDERGMRPEDNEL